MRKYRLYNTYLTKFMVIKIVYLLNLETMYTSLNHKMVAQQEDNYRSYTKI